MKDTTLDLVIAKLNDDAQLVLRTLANTGRVHFTVSRAVRARLTRLQLVTDVESLTVTERGVAVGRELSARADAELARLRTEAREAARTHPAPVPGAGLTWAGWSEGALEHP